MRLFGHRTRRTLTALLLAATLSPGHALAGDAEDVQATISSQLGAFKADNGEAAYGFAAPNITALFPSEERFMDMVRRGYPQVYDARDVTFGTLRSEGQGFRQEVHLTDSQGQSWIASYTLERQPDGTMKITGVQLRRGEDLSA